MYRGAVLQLSGGKTCPQSLLRAAGTRFFSSAQGSISQTTNASLFGMFQQLELALESGDLAAALRAYNLLAAQTQSSTGEKPDSLTLNAIETLGQKLQSGDLAAARQTLSDIARDSPPEPSATTDLNPSNSYPVEESRPQKPSNVLSAASTHSENVSATSPNSKSVDLLV